MEKILAYALLALMLGIALDLVGNSGRGLRNVIDAIRGKD